MRKNLHSGLGDPAPSVNDRLNDELERHAQVWSVDLEGEGTEVGVGLVWGDNPCVYYNPDVDEIGGGPREGVEAYLVDGNKDLLGAEYIEEALKNV